MVLCGDRKVLDFSVLIEINLVFVSGHRIDFICEWGSSWLDSSGGAEINLVFVGGIECDFV